MANKSILRDRYEDMVDEVIKQYVREEGLKVQMPKLVRKCDYKNYRIVVTQSQKELQGILWSKLGR